MTKCRWVQVLCTRVGIVSLFWECVGEWVGDPKRIQSVLNQTGKCDLEHGRGSYRYDLSIHDSLLGNRLWDCQTLTKAFGTVNVQ